MRISWASPEIGFVGTRLLARSRLTKFLPRLLEFDRAPFHCSVAEGKRLFPSHVWESCFKFSFVRNPWDREVSNYHYILEKERNPHHSSVRKLGSFENYIRNFLPEHAIGQLERLKDEQGSLGVDFVGRVENLGADMRVVGERINARLSLSKENSSAHEQYRHYYNNHTAEIVNRVYEEDISFFGYSFD